MHKTISRPVDTLTLPDMTRYLCVRTTTTTTVFWHSSLLFFRHNHAALESVLTPNPFPFSPPPSLPVLLPALVIKRKWHNSPSLPLFFQPPLANARKEECRRRRRIISPFRSPWFQTSTVRLSGQQNKRGIEGRAKKIVLSPGLNSLQSVLCLLFPLFDLRNGFLLHPGSKKKRIRNDKELRDRGDCE